MNNKIISFCDKWLAFFENSNGRVFEDQFGSDCEQLSFVMDCGKSFEAAYPNAIAMSGKAEDLKCIINQVNDPYLLGSLIYSQWRFMTHWSMGYDILKYSQWFKVALTRLREIC